MSNPGRERLRAATAGGGEEGDGGAKERERTHLATRARAADDLHDDGELGGLVLWVLKGRMGASGEREVTRWGRG